MGLVIVTQCHSFVIDVVPDASRSVLAISYAFPYILIGLTTIYRCLVGGPVQIRVVEGTSGVLGLNSGVSPSAPPHTHCLSCTMNGGDL